MNSEKYVIELIPVKSYNKSLSYGKDTKRYQKLFQEASKGVSQ